MIPGADAIFLRGRFREELNLELYAGGRRAAAVKLFRGRRPYYSPYAEVFDASPEFYGSALEDEVYGRLYHILEFESVLYVEYINDLETRRLLWVGATPVETRLGRALMRRGFLPIRDIYFPEGGREGSPKIQAVRL